MNQLKGKSLFSISEIDQLKALIKLRVLALPNKQKSIRAKMRKIGFYGENDWGIRDCQISDLDILINQGTIKINGNDKPISNSTNVEYNDSISELHLLSKDNNMQTILETFKQIVFDPIVNSEKKIPDLPGNYILVLKKKAILPTISPNPIMTKFEGFDVIYTGISGVSLRNRDYHQHFNGHAGISTIRKSLGVLFGYKLIPRDKDPNTGKTKFGESNECILSEWMINNLIMFILPSADFNTIESQLIDYFNPPFNLTGNSNSVNSQFRRYLKELRSNKNS